MLIKIIFLLTCLLGLGIGVLRYFQIIFNIDQGTGFFLQTDWTVWVFWIGIAALILLPLIGSIVQREPKARASRANLQFHGVFSLLLAGSILYDSYLTLSQGFTVESVALIITMLTEIAGILSAVVFIALGIHCLRGHTHRVFIGNLCAIPALWCALRIGVSLVTYATVIPISQRGLNLLFDVLILLFMIGQGRCFLGVHTVKGRRTCLSFGISAAMVGLISFVPGWIYSMNYTAINFGDPGLSTFTLALYALWFSGLAAFASPERDKSYFLSNKSLDRTVRFFEDANLHQEQSGTENPIDTKADV